MKQQLPNRKLLKELRSRKWVFMIWWAFVIGGYFAGDRLEDWRASLRLYLRGLVRSFNLSKYLVSVYS